MVTIQDFITCMKQGDNVTLAELFNENGVLHDSSLIKIGEDTMHLEGRMAVEMMFHSRFGINKGPFKITGVKQFSDRNASYFIDYPCGLVAVSAYLSELDEDGRIKRLNIYPL